MSPNEIFGYAVVLFAIFVIFGIVLKAFFTVSQQTAALVERFGKYRHTANAGLHFKLPLIDRIAGVLSLRVQQIEVEVETKTLDNVFVKVIVSVQCFVKADKIYEAFYKLTNANTQITAFVFDVVRARVPKLTLDDLFERKEEIAGAVREELCELMEDFGYSILKALVTDINPDAKVKAAMNEINEAQRLRVAANEKGEAEKILRIKLAEADARSMELSGQGLASQRKAIVEGLKESVENFQKSIKGTTAQDVMQLVLATQYYDTLKEIGASNRATTILLPAQSASHNMADQMRDAMIAAQQVKAATEVC
jgi:regulator of protease activity HflC (stomatin/prohibitin superfamily)